MRRLFTTEDALREGVTASALRWGERTDRWRRVDRGVWAEGPENPSPLDQARAGVLAVRGVACGRLAGVLLDLDGVDFRGFEAVVAPNRSGRRSGLRRRRLDPARVIVAGGVPCTDGLQTLVDLAPILDDDHWEQALESGLRRGLTTIEALPTHSRIRGVLARRGSDVPSTDSLLETLMVQLARTIPGLPPPIRQFVLFDEHGTFVARIDLCWPELGLFVELDGQQHEGQPVYDARRETAVVAATGWLCGRFTWTELTRLRRTTARRLAALAEQARRRPLVA